MRIRPWVLVCACLWAALACGAPRTIHVFTALVDNAHQGIVPVPARLGNGEDPAHNLYWGARYGVRTFFHRSADWTLAATSPRPAAGVLERCVFTHRTADVVLVADAYRGREIKRAISDFLIAAGGGNARTLRVAGATAAIHGGAQLVVFVGHDGLMDFTLDPRAIPVGPRGRDAIVLSCMSKQYFLPWLTRQRARPVLLTTGLMAPEAYTLHAACDAWIAGASRERIRERAAAAYHQYQHCGMAGARRLFYAGE